MEIPLTQGQVALVDDADFDWLNQRKWSARWSKITNSFYAISNSKTVDGKRYTVLMHREILGLVKGDKRDGDHIKTGMTLDNRRSNLRIATRSQNRQNSRIAINNTTGCKGLNYRRRSDRYEVNINVGGRAMYVGSSKSFDVAKGLWHEAVHRLHGEFARP